MRTKTDKMNKLLEFLNDTEDMLFKGGEREVVYLGKTYTKGEWRDYKAIIEKCERDFTKSIKSSNEYLRRNKEYNRTMANLAYYKNKKNKTENDYEKLEFYKTKLEKIIRAREAKKNEEQLKKLEKIMKNSENEKRGI